MSSKTNKVIVSETIDSIACYAKTFKDTCYLITVL